MKTNLLYFSIAVLLCVCNVKLHGQKEPANITAFKDTLHAMSDRTDNAFFKLHCQSMIDVINAQAEFSSNDVNFLNQTYLAFNDRAAIGNAKQLDTYLKRQRPFIMSWISPTDQQVSFSWVTPPADWDPNKSYPLYVQLHGLWDVASNMIQYMTYPYLNPPSYSYAFEDGYLLSPWGRGNMWYQGISETDIWECMAALEKYASINPARKYLCGHSMGGYGTWHIALSSSRTWAAIGLHAAALWFNSTELSTDAVSQMKNVPVFFVCGTKDELLSINQNLFEMLLDARVRNIMFMTFEGGHDYHQGDVEAMYAWMHKFVNSNVSTDIKTQTSVSASTVSAFPNPFQTTVRITYSLPESSRVTLEIYNSQGQIVKKTEYAQQAAGDNEISWTPDNLPQGVYYYSLTTDYSKYSNRMVYLK